MLPREAYERTKAVPHKLTGSGWFIGPELRRREYKITGRTLIGLWAAAGLATAIYIILSWPKG